MYTIEDAKKYERAVVILDDNNLEQCQINYFLGDELIEKDKLNELFMTIGFTAGITAPMFDFCRFFPHFTVVYPYLNLSTYDKVPKYLKQPIADSIDTIHFIRGISDLKSLSNSIGGFTPVIIRYRNNEELLSEGRNFPSTIESRKLIYDFAYNNSLKMEGIDISKLDFDEFSKLYQYVGRDMAYRISDLLCGPEEYGDVLYEKVKKLKVSRNIYYYRR